VEEICENGRNEYCEVYTDTSGQTCDEYCQANGFECIAGWDALSGSCDSKLLDDENRIGDGCEMSNDHQICECGIDCSVGARFIDNYGLELEQTEGPINLGDATWLFGAIGAGMYKMCRVTLPGVVLECRAMVPTLSLTEANWDAATITGSYDVQDLTYSATCSKFYFACGPAFFVELPCVTRSIEQRAQPHVHSHPDMLLQAIH
jgi:hypothetical protein